jgi:tRNA pseudouridine38-40 synthase
MFHGWQRQLGYDTIQQRIEESVVPFLKHTIVAHASGRTDAGVHALCQMAHFDSQKEVNCFKLQECMNFYLRDVPITVLSIENVPNSFHARLDATERSYVYKILNRRSKPSIYANRVWHVARYLDEKNMHTAAQVLLGKHDFSSFRATGCQSNSPVKTINKISVVRENDTIKIGISAKSFLYHQVRNIVGSLELVGNGKLTPADFKAILEMKNRKKAGQTAPACGLYFLETKYCM